MANVTIADLTSLTPPMTGAELLEIERSGTSYKVKAGDLAVSPPSAIAITSGAVSQDLDPLQLYYEITTGGTGGDELLNLPNLPLDANGVNGPYAGRTLVVAIKTQTNPADRVILSVAGSAGVTFLYPANFTPLSYEATAADGIVLDYAGSSIGFVWLYTGWFATNQVTRQYDDSVVQVANVSLDGKTQLRLLAGASGGSVSIEPDAAGHVLVSNLPISDPHVLNALWNNAGTLKISAGP